MLLDFTVPLFVHFVPQPSPCDEMGVSIFLQSPFCQVSCFFFVHAPFVDFFLFFSSLEYDVPVPSCTFEETEQVFGMDVCVRSSFSYGGYYFFPFFLFGCVGGKNLVLYLILQFWSLDEKE